MPDNPFDQFTGILAGLATEAQKAQLISSGIAHVAKIVGPLCATALLAAARAALGHGASEEDFLKVATLAYRGLKGRQGT